MQGKLTIGMATCGIASGAKKTVAKINEIMPGENIKEVGCIGSCYLEPIVGYEINDETYLYQKITEVNTSKLIGYLIGNNFENEFLLSKKSNLINHEFFSRQVKIVTKNCGFIDPTSLDDYKCNGGFNSIQKALLMQPGEVIDFIKRSGLRGRGGAGFLTGAKWEFISKHDGKKYLVCNADEGDPGAFMNRNLMESDPFRIIEGMLIGAYATNATNGIIYVRAEKPLAAKRMADAVKILYDNNLLGKNIFGKFDFDLEVRLGAGAYVCGEETALINSVMGKRGMPRLRPPYPADSGVDNLPTNVNNVETYGQATSIFEIGIDEYVKYGSEKSKGTKTFALTGKISRQGMVEVPFGTTLKTMVFDIGGANSGEFKAVQVGGPSGGCIPFSEIDVSVDYESLKSKGAHVGSGGLVVMDNDNSIVSICKYFLEFTQSESCGKCTPCREGTRRMLEILSKIEGAKATNADIDNLVELSNAVGDTALCGLGQAAPNPVLSSLKYFRPEFDAYIKKQFKYEVKEGCTDCKKCMKACPTHAIIENEDKKVAFILEDKCIHCGACMKVCPTHAIVRRAFVK